VSLLWVTPPLVLTVGAVALALAARRASAAADSLRASAAGLRQVAEAIAGVDTAVRDAGDNAAEIRTATLRARAVDRHDRPLA
jgi:hypothetical protein